MYYRVRKSNMLWFMRSLELLLNPFSLLPNVLQDIYCFFLLFSYLSMPMLKNRPVLMVNNNNIYCVNYLEGDGHDRAHESSREAKSVCTEKSVSFFYQSYWLFTINTDDAVLVLLILEVLIPWQFLLTPDKHLDCLLCKVLIKKKKH